jgi:drug/metabolite transporter (DMT)-like permease
MSKVRLITLTLLAMLAFAGNSLLCRLALKQTGIDPASFTTIRLLSGAMMLLTVIKLSNNKSTDKRASKGNWVSAIVLFLYAGCFSFAYVNLDTAIGALPLFGAVQATMISYGVWAGERLKSLQLVGLVLALGGLAALLLPGQSAPSLYDSLLMACAGIAWGVYSLLGKGVSNPTMVTSGNFLRAVCFAFALSAIMWGDISLNRAGFWYAVLSGVMASAIGYAIWYTVSPTLSATNAAIVQLSVPVIAALGGIVFLGESISLRLALCSLTILSGIALVIVKKEQTSNDNGGDIN